MVITQTAALLDRYRDYLQALEWQLDDEPAMTADDYVDLLSYGEVIDLLTIRDAIAAQPLNAAERSELERLDALLRRHTLVIATNTPDAAESHPADHWWWHLDPSATMPRVTVSS